ncbi:MAG: ribokinase [Defluviitaleaceae bacterium]|nr:ribokinase [Defluviitaleaceae bacterium]
MKKAPRILVIGSINMDLLLLTPRIPLPGETMLSETYRFGPGGKGANQAVACAKLGGDTTFVCKVGDDAFGEQLVQSLTTNGVDTNCVSVSPGKPSGFCVIMLEDGNNRIIAHLAANLDLTKADIDRAFDGDYDGMLVQFELAEDMVVYACQKAREQGIPFIVDAGPALDFPLEKIHGMEILSPNETETAALCGITPTTDAKCLAAAEMLTARSGAKHVVLKLGEKGAAHYTDGQLTRYPALKVTPVDTTAAGDVFTAALAVQYWQGAQGDMPKAIQFANAAGALAVTKAGAQESVPTLQEVALILPTPSPLPAPGTPHTV